MSKKFPNGEIVTRPDPKRKHAGNHETLSMSSAIRQAIRAEELAEFWAGILNDPLYSTAERMAAARELANRGWGLPTAHVVVHSQESNVLELNKFSRQELMLLRDALDCELLGSGKPSVSLDAIATADYNEVADAPRKK